MPPKQSTPLEIVDRSNKSASHLLNGNQIYVLIFLGQSYTVCIENLCTIESKLIYTGQTAKCCLIGNRLSWKILIWHQLLPCKRCFEQKTYYGTTCVACLVQVNLHLNRAVIVLIEVCSNFLCSHNQHQPLEMNESGVKKFCINYKCLQS